jgi:hypothetical protein
MEKGNTLFIEVGPGRTLCTNVRNNKKFEHRHQTFQLVKTVKETEADLYYLHTGIIQLWLNGIEPDWTAFYSNETRNKISLPAYSFKKISYPAAVDVRGIMSSLLDGGNGNTATAAINKWTENHKAFAARDDQFTFTATQDDNVVSETEQQLKALKKSMVEKPLVNIDSYTGCDGCFYLRKDIVCLEAKLNAPPSKPEITFAIDPKKFKKSLNPKNKKYKFMVKENNKSQSNVVCHYCCTKGHAIAKCRARKLLVPKGILQ